MKPGETVLFLQAVGLLLLAIVAFVGGFFVDHDHAAIAAILYVSSAIFGLNCFFTLKRWFRYYP